MSGYRMRPHDVGMPGDNSHSDDDDDDDDSDERLPPAAVAATTKNGRNRGWQGDELEMEHLRESSSSLSKTTTQSHVAVDLNQFRNEEVGKGYQAKHVVRQRTAERQPKIDIHDMTAATRTTTATTAVVPKPKSSSTSTSSSKDERKEKKRKKEEDKQRESSSSSSRKRRGGKKEEEHATTTTAEALLEKYLHSPGMRTFRKELEKMEASGRGKKQAR